MEKYVDDTIYYDGPKTCKENFKEKILDNFIEEKTIVTIL